MAFNAAPNHWIASWAEDGTTIEVPIASFPELTAGEADGATGDIRKVVYAIMQKLYTQFVAEGANQPARMQINRSQSLLQDGTIAVSFGINFNLTPGTIDVSAEPA